MQRNDATRSDPATDPSPATGASRTTAASPATGVPEVTGVSRHPVLDSHVDAFTLQSFLDTIGSSVRRRTPLLVANHNLQSLSLHRLDADFRALYQQADHVFIDGAPVVSLANLRGAGLDMTNRLAVLDWIWPLLALAEAEGWRIVHLGGKEPMLSRIREAVHERHPDVDLTLIDGYFDIHSPRDNAATVAAITAASPSVLLVGMGMPRQEHWLLSVRGSLPPCTVITVGGIMSFIGGERATPPRWLGSLHLEWAFRLLTEPRRLWRRYLVDSLVLVPAVLLELAHLVRSRLRRKA